MTERQPIHQATQSLSCPGCGARPVWSPEEGMLKCPYCGATTPVAQDHAIPPEHSLQEGLLDAQANAQENWGEEKRVMRCQGCGAETLLGPEETATLCPFCGSPHVLEDQSAAGIAPESVLPFRIGQPTAVSAFRKWLKKRWFAPGKAKKMATLGQITGVYLPHWTYDSSAVATYQGQAGDHYTVQVPVTVERNGRHVTEMRTETRTRWRPTSGVVNHDFDDVLVPGSRRLAEDLLERVQPFDLTQLCRYQPGFLSGFVSEKPSVDIQQGWAGAQQRMEAQLHEMAQQDILTHADEAIVNHLDAHFSQTRYKLTLLPMYLSSFTYKQKQYHVLVNGENGRCGGQAPISPLRVLVAVLAGIALLMGLYYLLMYL